MPDGGPAVRSKPTKRGKRQKRCVSSGQRIDVPAYLMGQRIDVPAYLMPQSIDELRELAALMAAAGWAPDSYRDLTGNYLHEKIEMAILHGASVGLGPVAAAQSIAVIDGMPTIWGDGALALVERSGLLEDISEEYVTDAAEGLTAICTMRRRGRPTPIVNRFSMAMAEQARLTLKEGPWQSYPQRMLRMRARSWTIRDGFADVLRGLHIREEVEDHARAGFAASLQLVPPRRDPNEPIPGGPLPPRRIQEQASTLKIPADARPMNNERAEPKKPEVDLDAASPGAQEVDGVIGPAAGAAPANAATSEQAAEIAAATFETAVRPESDEAEPSRVGAVAPFDGSVAETGVGPRQAEIRGPVYSVVDADGVIGDYSDIASLKAAFERIALDQDLSPEQVARVWNCNQPAVYVVEAQLGTRALERVRARMNGARHPTPAVTPAPQHCALNKDPSLTRRPSRRGLIATGTLQLEIDPGWGDQKIFQHYRARLHQLHDGGAGKASVLARFRETNGAIEARLRRMLPEQMQQIDAVYAYAAVHAR